MHQISRHKLVDSIMGAAHDVGLDNIPSDAYCALLTVGYRATEVGSNYSDGPGCPMVQAGLVTAAEANIPRAESPWAAWVEKWIDAYDGRIGPGGWHVAKVID